LIIGAGGQLGRALIMAMPSAIPISRSTVDLASPESITTFDFAPYGVVINAAAYTKVDAAETEVGRREAWAVNVGGMAFPDRGGAKHRFTLVHVSSDYVFDGSQALHTETEPFSPLGVYGRPRLLVTH
jgi:dTDP-4-dehydrorhamnose 3,5-epimerase